MRAFARFKSTTSNPKEAQPSCEDSILPEHIAIIMDGNGRWAKDRGLSRGNGHRKGAEALKNLLKSCRDMNIRYLSVYAFSAENWRRPEVEVNDLMSLLRFYLENEIKTLHDNNIRLYVTGSRSGLDDDILKMIENSENRTAGNNGFNLALCLNYGSRQEIINAVKTIADKTSKGDISVNDIDESMINEHLYLPQFPEPDLLIRTGGEKRLSNFMLWQMAYTEFYFSDILWPDFSAEDLKVACRHFAKRERRYGGTK